MDYHVLGPLEVVRNGSTLDLGIKQRALVALLLINANQVVSTDRIIDELWGEDAGTDRQNALWVVVSRIRSALDPDREKRSDGTILITRPPGYVLVIDPPQLDANRFEALWREGRSLLDTDPAAALVVLDEALALWRGRALEEFTYEEFAAAEILRLEEMRLSTVTTRIEAQLGLGGHAEIVGELEGLVRQHPSREQFTSLLMTALYRSGRQGDALDAYADRKAYLAEELGLDPSPELTSLEERILLDDPDLAPRPDAGPGARTGGPSVRGYELREQIGSSPSGDVYTAFQPSVGREVAIKVVTRELANDPEFIRAFESGTRLVNHLEHPQIVPVYDFWREPDRAFLVMRRFAPGSLAHVLETDRIEPGIAIKMVEQIGSALTAAHRRGVPHGDVRPDKILVDEANNAYLGAFGLRLHVRQVAADAEPDRYVAPEQMTTGRPSCAADIYSLGRVAERLLGEADGGASVAGVIAIACAEVPDDRFPDMAAFKDALTAARGLDRHHSPTGEIANPYRGLLAFEDTDADRFFGRERLVERLLARLGYSGPKGRFVALVGPSGSGKSSVVRAGVVPALRNAAIPGSDHWFVVTMTPGRRPFEALAEALLAVAVDPPPHLATLLRTDGIGRVAASIPPDPTAHVVIVVDQLEELFSQADETTADEFMTAIADAVSFRQSLMKVIVTLRADFYDRPLRHAAFGELIRLGTEVITPMTARELERAISGPAATVDVDLEPGVVATMVAETNDQGTTLPLLQYALTELFERRSGSTITAGDYEALGGVSATLARRADELYADLGAQQRIHITQVLLRLVAISEDSADTRRRALLSELTAAAGAAVEPLIDRFVTHRLLTYDRDPITRGPTVEIAHEALLTAWARLRLWIDETRDDIRAQRRLGEVADEWDARGRDAAYLLGGGRLARYDGWVDEPPVRLTAAERGLLVASRDAAESDVRAERRRVRRLRRLVGGVGAALAIALVAAGVAVAQQQRAEEAATTAVEAAEAADLSSLISRSAGLHSDDPVVALLLALEARKRAITPETDGAVLSALASSTVGGRVVSRERLTNDCLDTSQFVEQDHGTFELATQDGHLIGRDPMTGVTTDMGPTPGGCAVGARIDDYGLAVTPDLSAIWTGPGFEHPLVFSEPTLPIWAGSERFLAVTGLLDVETPDSVTLRDTATGDVIGEPIAESYQISSATTADGSLFAVGFARPPSPQGEGQVVIADGATAEVLVRLDTIDGPLALRFDEATRHLVAGFLGGRIMVIEPRTGEIVTDVQTEPGIAFSDILARPDGTIMAVAQSGVIVVDPATGTITRPLELGAFEDAFIEPGGLIVVVLPGSIVVYDVDAGAAVERSWSIDPLSHAALGDGTAAVVDIANQIVSIIELETGERTELEVSLDDRLGRTLLAYPDPAGVWMMSANHFVSRWVDGVIGDSLYMGSTEGVTTNLDGRTAMSGRHRDRYATVGRRLDGSLEASVIQLEAESAELVFTVDVVDVLAVIPTADGGMYAVDRSGVLSTYSPTGELIDTLETGGELLYEMALNEDGTKLSLSSDDGGVYLVNTVEGTVQDLQIAGWAPNVGFSGDGTMMAMTLGDGTVRLWDVDRTGFVGVVWTGTGTVLSEPGWYDGTAKSIWMASSGRLLEIPLDPDRWVERACEILDRELTVEEWERLVPGDEPQRPACG